METEIERLRKKAQAFEDSAASLESSAHQYRQDAAKARAVITKLEAEAAAAAKTYGQREADRLVDDEHENVFFRKPDDSFNRFSIPKMIGGSSEAAPNFKRYLAAAIDAGRADMLEKCEGIVNRFFGSAARYVAIEAMRKLK